MEISNIKICILIKSLYITNHYDTMIHKILCVIKQILKNI